MSARKSCWNLSSRWCAGECRGASLPDGERSLGPSEWAMSSTGLSMADAAIFPDVDLGARTAGLAEVDLGRTNL